MTITEEDLQLDYRLASVLEGGGGVRGRVAVLEHREDAGQAGGGAPAGAHQLPGVDGCRC